MNVLSKLTSMSMVTVMFFFDIDIDVTLVRNIALGNSMMLNPVYADEASPKMTEDNHTNSFVIIYPNAKKFSTTWSLACKITS